MQDIFEHMQKIIAEQFAVDPDEIGEVREEELATLSTVGDCVNFLTKKLDK